MNFNIGDVVKHSTYSNTSFEVLNIIDDYLVVQDLSTQFHYTFKKNNFYVDIIETQTNEYLKDELSIIENNSLYDFNIPKKIMEEKQ